MAQIHPMRKKLVNEKRDALKKLDPKELIDRICSYPNQDLLNIGSDGEQRDFPVGDIAKWIQESDYQMSEKQYYKLIHDFSALTVPNMKIVGVTFRPNNGAEFERTLIDHDKTKFVYETDYLLRPEPTNPYDENAVMVMVRKETGELHHLGYLSRDFVAAHPITEEMELRGNMIDYSNGKFKMVSYQLAVDIEPLDVRHRIEEQNRLSLSDADLQGIGDLSLDNPEHPGLDSCTYITDFHLKNPVYDLDIAQAYLQSNDMTGVLTEHIQQSVMDGALSPEEDFSGNVVDAVWVLQDGDTGQVVIQTNMPLTNKQSEFVSDWIESECNYGLGERFEQQDFAFYGDADRQAYFDCYVDSYELTQVSGPSCPEESKICVYETYFSLTNPVIDYEAAREYLAEDDTIEALKDHIKYDVELGELFPDEDFRDHVKSIEWQLIDESSGRIELKTDMPLSERQCQYMSDWIEGQNADGLGEGFEQQSFACYEDTEYIYYDEEEGELLMASFDIEHDDYKLTQVSGPSYSQDVAESPEQSEQNGLELTEDDLSFARQMTLADYGIG